MLAEKQINNLNSSNDTTFNIGEYNAGFHEMGFL